MEIPQQYTRAEAEAALRLITKPAEVLGWTTKYGMETKDFKWVPPWGNPVPATPPTTERPYREPLGAMDRERIVAAYGYAARQAEKGQPSPMAQWQRDYGYLGLDAKGYGLV